MFIYIGFCLILEYCELKILVKLYLLHFAAKTKPAAKLQTVEMSMLRGATCEMYLKKIE